MTNAPEPGGRVPRFEMRHRLALALEHADLSVGDIADELGVHRNTIGRYLGGKHVPRSVLIAWALRTGVPFRWIERGEWDDDGDGGGNADKQPVTLGEHRNVRPLPVANLLVAA